MYMQIVHAHGNNFYRARVMIKACSSMLNLDKE